MSFSVAEAVGAVSVFTKSSLGVEVGAGATVTVTCTVRSRVTIVVESDPCGAVPIADGNGRPES